MKYKKILIPDDDFYFLPYQEEWILDTSPLRIIQKSRQVGITYADAYDSVLKASEKDARLDVWISSREGALTGKAGRDVFVQGAWAR